MYMHKISMNSARNTCACTAVASESNKQDESFFQTWNGYKCNCHSEQNLNTSGRNLFTSIVIGLESILILLVIIMTIGWIWTCKIAIKRGKLIKMKGEIKPLSYTRHVKVQARQQCNFNIMPLSYIQKMPFLCLPTRPTASTPYQLKIRYLK